MPESATDLITVTVRCHWCGAPYRRQIEPEYAATIRKFGICDECYEREDAARAMEE